jgi:membrane carboxypeptidase/penicillin-binding protein
VFGADIPAPIWRETMTAALSGTPEHGFHRPGGDYMRKGSGEEEDDKDKKDKDKKDKNGKEDAAGDDGPELDWLDPN